jgi:hypothetical protein
MTKIRRYQNQEEKMEKYKYINLQKSESVVAQMASTIFAAYIMKNEVNKDNENDYIKKATHIAIKMADYTDRIVKSDEEWISEEETLTPIKNL